VSNADVPLTVTNGLGVFGWLGAVLVAGAALAGGIPDSRAVARKIGMRARVILSFAR
jgi:hypothetical protein